MDGLLNIGSLVLGLIAWALPITAIEDTHYAVVFAALVLLNAAAALNLLAFAVAKIRRR